MMHHNFFKKTLRASSLFVLLISNMISASDDASIARGERRPEGRYPMQGEGSYRQYNPQVREDARQDINRNADANALENAAGGAGAAGAVPEAYPPYLYPSENPTNGNGGSTININNAPQGSNLQR